MFRLGVSAWALSAVVLSVSAAQAGATGGLVGVVLSGDGRPVPGATVVVASSELIGGPRQVATGVSGEFELRSLPPGDYSVWVDEVGAEGAIGVGVELGRTSCLRIVLDGEEMSAVVCLDAVRVGGGMSLDRHYLDRAAIGMDQRDGVAVVGHAPGVVGQGSGDPRVLGSVGSDNAYVIDGLDLSDPLSGRSRFSVPFDALAAVAIQTTGFEADTGRLLGGAVNLVTSSGGNDFAGSVDVRYRDRYLHEEGDHFDRSYLDESQYQVQAALGGPLLRDRLWFFAAVRSTRADSTPYRSPVTAGLDDLELLGKLTWQAADAHRLGFKVAAASARLDNSNASRFLRPEAAAARDEDDLLVQVSAGSVLSPSLVLSATAGSVRSSVDVLPASGDLDSPGYFDEDGWRYFGNWYTAQLTDRDSDQVRARLSWLPGGTTGRHELSAGLDYRRLSTTTCSFYVGDGLHEVLQVFSEDSPLGTGGTDVDGDGYTDHLLTTDLDPAAARGGVRSTGDLWSVHLQDSWRARHNLTVSAGMRFDSATFTDDGGRTVAGLEDWQPRLGLAWDPLGTGRQVVRASWVRVMDPATASIPDLVNGRAQGWLQYTGYEFYCILPGTILCDREWLRVNRALDGEELVTVDGLGNEHYWYMSQYGQIEPFETVDTLGAGSLRPQYAEVASVAIEHRLWSQATVALEYVNKKTRDLLEDVCNNNEWIWDSSVPPGDYDDPETWTALRECTGYVIANVPDLKRDYEALIGWFEMRLAGLDLRASYTYSTSEGSSAASAPRGYVTSLFDVFPTDYYNTYGYLPDDRRHRVKLTGYWLLPYDSTVSWNAFWSSGPALDYWADCSRVTESSLESIGVDPALAALCFSGYGELFLEPRGSRRGEDNYQLDLQVSKAFRIGRVSLEGIVSVINVLGDEQPTAYSTEELRSWYWWGDPLAYQRPRRWEVGLRVEF